MDSVAELRWIGLKWTHSTFHLTAATPVTQRRRRITADTSCHKNIVPFSQLSGKKCITSSWGVKNILKRYISFEKKAVQDINTVSWLLV